MLLYSIIVNIAILSFAPMDLLVTRDAIYADDLKRYNEVMKTIVGSQILNLYSENLVIRLDIHEYPSEQVIHLSVRPNFNSHVNKIIRSEVFKPSRDADAYFRQEDELAREFLQQSSGEGTV
ncbi:hypothetical protein FOC1_g10006113 [Fusarium oxysporum f. sp. cubense race 1]|uniref:Uncharacterized protein n=1 Tax=Fusarium oxysporum f. sp. cubense (strain race 1) TaxID=1229664 RepID=N4UR15_FUSC1|nr:hypothetical protein FOC1_g10006113 [Fusarium oxysporum f. sp. cubense race 1]